MQQANLFIWLTDTTHELMFSEGNHFLIPALQIAYLIYLLGITGILFNFKNFLITMLCIELMYLGVVASLTIISAFTFEALGQIYALTLLIIAAAESAVGLGILIVLFRYGNSIEFEDYQELKG